MSFSQKALKLTVTSLMLISSMSLASCAKRVSPAAIVPTPATTPVEQPIADYPSYDNAAPLASVPTATPNAQVGSFLADQSIVNDWQAKGIAVVGGSIYLSVSDVKGLSKKGSVIKMNSSDGKAWKNLGSTLGGLRHPMDSTVEGLAVSGSTIIAVDSASKVYTLDTSKGGVKVIKAAGGKDVAAGAGGIFIANGMVEKSDASASARNAINGMSATGGIGADNSGNVYAVSGTTIKKADQTGQVQDVITSDLATPIDVAVDNRNGDIYVLETTMIKRFTTNGQLLASFSNGAVKASTIAVDEAGSVYVADTGTSNKDSKVIKFAAALADNSAMGGGMNNYNYNSGSTGGYNYGSQSTGGAYGSYAAPTTQSAAAKRR